MTGGAISLRPGRRARRPSLTPLIDVVFLLLVFFMLAARFGAETGIAVTAATPGGGDWDGPPRLIALGTNGILLNGAPVEAGRLAEELAPLMPAHGSPVVLHTGEGVPVHRLAEVIGALRAGGIINVVVVE